MITAESSKTIWRKVGAAFRKICYNEFRFRLTNVLKCLLTKSHPTGICEVAVKTTVSNIALAAHRLAKAQLHHLQ